MGESAFREQALPLGQPGLPKPGEVHLWFLDLVRLASPLGSAPGQRMTPRQERSTRRFYLRLLLGAYLGLPGKDVHISRLVKGKPVLDASRHPQSIEFSSAGSDGCCLIAVASEGKVGIDLERLDRRTGQPRSLVRRYFSSAEQGAFDGVDDAAVDAHFIHTWACKEAVVKAAGLGIANQLCRFTVEVDPARAPSVLDMQGDDARAWRLAMVRPETRFLGAVALRSPELQLHCRSLVAAQT